MHDGQHVAVFGVPTSTGNLTEDAPRVQVVDVGAGALAADVPLAGLKAGQFEVGPGDRLEYPYRMYRPALAWDLARSRVYVVYPDEERVSVVDLAAGKVTASELMRPRASWFHGLLAHLVPAVEAKSIPTTQRWAVLSPDGSRLYVSGSREWATRVDANRYEWKGAQEGLRIIDTKDLAEIGRRDLNGNAFALAPGGRRILVHAFQVTADPANDRQMANKHRVGILESDGLTDVANLEIEDAFYLRGFSPDGHYAYVDRPGGPPPYSSLRVLDVEDGRVVGARMVDGLVSNLLLNPSGGPEF